MNDPEDELCPYEIPAGYVLVESLAKRCKLIGLYLLFHYPGGLGWQLVKVIKHCGRQDKPDHYVVSGDEGEKIRNLAPENYTSACDGPIGSWFIIMSQK